MATIRALSLNIHKGFSAGNRRFVLPALRDAVRATGADIVFLQEVLGRHDIHQRRVAGWPTEPQMEYLADSVWPSFAYGRNAIYESGHHGNAILSKFDIQNATNVDISSSRAERRGFLHGSVQTPAGPVMCVCLHLSLRERDRSKQFSRIVEQLGREVRPEHALIIAGDFNDWRRRAQTELAQPLGLQEAFLLANGCEARTFPCSFPILTLDRIYFRGLRLVSAHTLHQKPWRELSDHAGLMAVFEGGS
ncbi:MAG TPA: endonuclease/exonuclease/phosphatase family protein [Phycisphaerales bacterium]